MVPEVGLEPTRLAALGPKPSVYTNFTTLAQKVSCGANSTWPQRTPHRSVATDAGAPRHSSDYSIAARLKEQRYYNISLTIIQYYGSFKYYKKRCSFNGVVLMDKMQAQVIAGLREILADSGETIPADTDALHASLKIMTAISAYWKKMGNHPIVEAHFQPGRDIKVSHGYNEGPELVQTVVPLDALMMSAPS